MNPATAVFIAHGRTVSVVSQDGNQVAYGSGVILRYRQVLTCFHLLHSDMKFSVEGHEAKVLFAFPAQDLVILEADTPNFEPLTFSDVPMGQVVFYVGNPAGHSKIRVMGIVVDLDERFLYFDSTVLPGASGSGLWDREGNLVGIVKAREMIDGVPGFGIAVPASVVKQVLNWK